MQILKSFLIGMALCHFNVASFDSNHEDQILALPSNDVSTPEIISSGKGPPQNGRGEKVVTHCKLASFKLGVFCSKSN